MPVTQFGELLTVLADRQVEFIIVGGLAATIHGSARHTLDLDIVYRRSGENIHRLTAALSPYAPYLRGAPAGLPFHWAAETLTAGLNFTLTTTLGWIDLLGEVTGGGGYDDLLPHATQVAYQQRRCLCVDLPTLIVLKRAAGRPKDNEILAELEALQEERGEID
jgi:predicted nucleotidyltransferase